MRHLRLIMRITWMDKVTNKEILEPTGLASMEYLLIRKNIRWIGHLMRMSPEGYQSRFSTVNCLLVTPVIVVFVDAVVVFIISIFINKSLSCTNYTPFTIFIKLSFSANQNDIPTRNQPLANRLQYDPDKSIRRQGGVRRSIVQDANKKVLSRQMVESQYDSIRDPDLYNPQYVTDIQTVKSPHMDRYQSGHRHHHHHHHHHRHPLSELEQQLRELLYQRQRLPDITSPEDGEEPIYDEVLSDQAIPDVHPETLYSLQGTANTQDPEPVYENPEDLHPDFIYSNDNSTRSTDEEDWSEDEFSEFDEQGTSLSSTEMLVKRKQVLDEIVSTEIDYVNKLLCLFKISLRIEGANQVRQMFPDNVLSMMFPSIETLYRLHAEHILPAFRHRQIYWNDQPYLYDIMAKYVPFLSVYKMYTSQYGEANALIVNYRKNSREFRKLLNNIEAKVVEHIDKDIKECQDILKEKDLYGDFSKIQARFDDTLSILVPNTRLLKEGPATEIISRNYLNKKYRYLFLFSELLLVCSKKLTGTFGIRLTVDINQIKFVGSVVDLKVNVAWNPVEDQLDSMLQES
ncbi:hypothetical protein LSH36_21g11013 [Paralvinella palmiformis]|uniref:DH domain-containing protein n=1 Tax=Paralvinella palmiformis TaxID=53620 RepID=A0AAD9NFF2_9ANNE|nr:hypothetical protein LSH36_21g11013 [Paralvinella palmiformis]